MWKWTKDSLLLSKSGPQIIPASKQELELAYLMNGVLLEEQDLLLDKKFLHLFPLEKALKYKLHVANRKVWHMLEACSICFCFLYKLLLLKGLPTSQIASSVFTLGTAAVLPFYTLMVFAPKSELTKKSMESSVPFIVLGLLYAYLLYLSWTPDTLKLMFASKYWLPEMYTIVNDDCKSLRFFLLSHRVLAIWQVFQDGLQNQIETRHSVSLCLLFCPIGIVTHFVTKAVAKTAADDRHKMH
ncbi:hypothetical protein GOBAR_AA19902 [Gossypium barbadense]|uniref:Uncharacterized protein n=1 Tax=Gossypium barbadense TaxID=3634 RepID=A0A2P5XBP6_GOSBA|nr:hypothetical protein GOBAR_AA19902 [Gossypium barbadense]